MLYFESKLNEKSGAEESGKTGRRIVAPLSVKTHFVRKTRSKTGSSCIRRKIPPSFVLSLENGFLVEAKRYFRGEEYRHSAATPGPGSPPPMKTNRRKSEKPSTELKKTSKQRKKTSKKLEKTLKTSKKPAKNVEFPRGFSKFD